MFQVTLPEPEPVEAIPQDIPLDVVYEDDDVIVVNKPVGMVVHPPPGIRTAHWSTHCYITVENHFPESMEVFAPALFTGSTGTRRG